MCVCALVLCCILDCSFVCLFFLLCVFACVHPGVVTDLHVREGDDTLTLTLTLNLTLILTSTCVKVRMTASNVGPSTGIIWRGPISCNPNTNTSTPINTCVGGWKDVCVCVWAGARCDDDGDGDDVVCMCVCVYVV